MTPVSHPQRLIVSVLSTQQSTGGKDHDSQTQILLGMDAAHGSDDSTSHRPSPHCYVHTQTSSACQDVEHQSDSSMSCKRNQLQ